MSDVSLSIQELEGRKGKILLELENAGAYYRTPERGCVFNIIDLVSRCYKKT